MAIAVKDTVWKELNEENAHPHIDHADFESTFSAFQRKEKRGGDGDHHGADAAESAKHREISVIDGRYHTATKSAVRMACMHARN
jgi:hypothetical protein